MARILIIDDSDSVRSTLRNLLTEMKHQVVEAEDGKIALDILEKVNFDITKLYPVNNAEKIPGAIGVLADDIVAGLMTAGIIIFLNIFGIDL